MTELNQEFYSELQKMSRDDEMRPKLLIRGPNNQDVIPALLAHMLTNLLYAVVFVTLWLKYPKQTLIEYSTSIFGRFAGKVIGILYIWYFIFHASMTLRQFNDFLLSRFLIRTPMEVIGVGILLICIYVG